MNIAARLLIAVLMAAAAATLAWLLDRGRPALELFALLTCATVATALLTALLPGRDAPTGNSGTSGQPEPGAAPGRGREQGAVKWFSQTKGVGCISRDNGDDVFVHYRNILGEGRRSLRDGERVTFRVAQTDKGPQAEDVESVE